MVHYQVRADLGDGRRMLFGVLAPDERAAWAKAAEVIGDPEWQGNTCVELQEISRPADRKQP